MAGLWVVLVLSDEVWKSSACPPVSLSQPLYLILPAFSLSFFPPCTFSFCQQLLETPCLEYGTWQGLPPLAPAALTHSHLIPPWRWGQERAANNNRTCHGLMKRLQTALRCWDPAGRRPEHMTKFLKVIKRVFEKQRGHSRVADSLMAGCAVT